MGVRKAFAVAFHLVGTEQFGAQRRLVINRSARRSDCGGRRPCQEVRDPAPISADTGVTGLSC
jgi:hypothetical protein